MFVAEDVIQTILRTFFLGHPVGSGTISAVGQVDDVLLLAIDIFSLKLLVMLTEEYYHKYRVKLEPGKTRLLAYSNKRSELKVKLATAADPISINSVPVHFTQEAVMRSAAGHLPNVLHRVTEHKKSLGAVISAQQV